MAVRDELFKFEECENIINKEVGESEAYLDKCRIIETELANLLNEKVSSFNAADMTVPQNTILRYPKLKLPTFDGNVKNWLAFWGQFEKIDGDCNLDNDDKFAYLLQPVERGSAAENLIKSFPPGAASYNKALKQLQLSFGSEDIL
ncbi:hypothetical protein X975_15895, partial [Stegodyphus mimosarum]